MTKYTIEFEGTVTEEVARAVLAGYCTILRIQSGWSGLIAKVEADDWARLERHLEVTPAVVHFVEGE